MTISWILPIRSPIPPLRESLHRRAPRRVDPRWARADGFSMPRYLWLLSCPGFFLQGGGIPMKQFVIWFALVALATSGCAQSKMFAHRGCGCQACHVTRSQSAPRLAICRTSYCDAGGCAIGAGCCDSGCCGDCCDDGCCDDGCCGGGSNCGSRGCGKCRQKVGAVACGLCPHSAGCKEMYNFTPSPPVGQVAYPYYTVRGPRDFLRNNPPSIGPY